MSVRDKRLQSEYERVKLVLAGQTRIVLRDVDGTPPDRYVVEYRVRSLAEANGDVQERDSHVVEITLGRDYPRQKPRCVMLTPVFHPNIDHLAICTEDIGAAGQTLDRTLIFIAQMLTYQAYNLQAPRDGEAARWVSVHADLLPLESIEFHPHFAADFDLEADAAVRAERALAARDSLGSCSNCAAVGAMSMTCVRGHHSCRECIVQCASCGKNLCLTCGPTACSRCSALQCSSCARQCRVCGTLATERNTRDDYHERGTH